MRAQQSAKWIGKLGIAAAVAAVAGFGPGAADAQVEVLFSRFAPPTDIINTEIINPWAAKVEEVTAGRVKIKFSATSLAAPQQQWEMVTQGVADGAYLFNGFQQNRLLLPQIAHLPFLSPGAEASAVGLWRTYKKHFEEKNEYAGVALVGLLVGPTGQFYSLTDQPLDSIERFRDLKTWGLPGVPARALGKLGASVVPGPAVRIHEIVSKGIVDAHVGIGPYHVETYNAAPFTKSVTILPGGISAPSFSVILSENVWARIPGADRALVMSVSGEALARASEIYDSANRAALERFIAKGIKRVDASPDFVARLKEEWRFFEEEWLENAAKRGVDGPAALAFFRQQL